MELTDKEKDLLARIILKLPQTPEEELILKLFRLLEDAEGALEGKDATINLFKDIAKRKQSL